MTLLHELLDKLNEEKLKVVVVGDSILDDYFQVEANRVSPEFPIPVMLSENASPTYSYPGGAANVALQLRNFNVDSYLVSIIDVEAKGIFNEHGINTSGSICVDLNDAKNVVPRKKRLYSGEFPLCRWDIEQPNMGLTDGDLNDLQCQLLKRVHSLKPDVVILSDYGKGVFKKTSQEKEVLNFSKNMWIKDQPWITIVDPKNDDLMEWKGCTVFKPNNHEAEALSKQYCPKLEKSDHRGQAQVISGVLECESVVITHGGEKVVGYDKSGWLFYGGHHGEARYPIGAGDCFIATLAMAYPFFKPEEAAKIAYEMGAIYVNTKDRYIGPEDILNDESKIKTPEELVKVVESHSVKFGFTNGCYDILHSGHMELLKFAKSKCDKLIVALNDDESVKRLKGQSRPVKPLEQRLKVLECLEFVDYVTYYKEDTPLEAIQMIKPHCIIKGEDYSKEEVVGYNEVKGKVYLCPLVDNQSTSNYAKRCAPDYSI
jgi:D-beta-D-heptose 7-phosphate kinase/D-beta-D-heptose 1-phosphate adenosyltransferase